MLLRLFFLLVMVLGLPGVACAREKITLATLEWLPYTSVTLEGYGYAALVIKEAFQRNNIDVDVQFHQWTRVVGLARHGKVDGYFPEYFNADIAHHSLVSDPFPGGPLGFFKLKKNKIAFASLADLRGYSIGTVKSYTNTREFDDADFLNKEPVKDDLTNFKKLTAGRIDLLVADQFVGNYIVAHHMPEKKEDIEFMESELAETMSLHVCFPESRSKSGYYLQMFNDGLHQMWQDGTLQQIFQEYRAEQFR